MELTVTRRKDKKKSDTKQIRRDGNIPAIVYSKGQKGEEIVIDGNAFKKYLNCLEKGTLSSQVFSLNFGKEKCEAIIKEIQYNVITYDPSHIDFERLHDDVRVILNVPIKVVKAVDCVGVKLGGLVKQVVRYVKVCCLPKDIPGFFEFDVADLTLGQSKKLSDLNMPVGVKPLVDLNVIAVSVARK